MPGPKLTLEKELQMARTYAVSNDSYEGQINRGICNAEELAKEQGKDISREVKEIRKVQEDTAAAHACLVSLQAIAEKREKDISLEIRRAQEKLFEWKFN